MNGHLTLTETINLQRPLSYSRDVKLEVWDCGRSHQTDGSLRGLKARLPSVLTPSEMSCRHNGNLITRDDTWIIQVITDCWIPTPLPQIPRLYIHPTWSGRLCLVQKSIERPKTHKSNIVEKEYVGHAIKVMLTSWSHRKIIPMPFIPVPVAGVKSNPLEVRLMHA